MQQPVAKVLIFSGIALVIIGLIGYFWGSKFSWLGRLPGDIRIEKENFKFYFPITTMVLLSLVFTLVLHLIRKLF
jgi:hypothetical protein